MQNSSSKKELARARILAGAARTFRSHGYGAGVDGVAKAAGVTSGAFYAYFRSKAEAFRETVVAGMQELEGALRSYQRDAGAGWSEQFVDFYLGTKRTCPLTESCALQSLTGEVARADHETRAAFEQELRAVIVAAAEGSPAGSEEGRRNEAIAMLALLSGGVSLARAVHDPALAQEIASAVRASLLPRASAAQARPKPPTRPRVSSAVARPGRKAPLDTPRTRAAKTKT